MQLPAQIMLVSGPEIQIKQSCQWHVPGQIPKVHAPVVPADRNSYSASIPVPAYTRLLRPRLFNYVTTGIQNQQATGAVWRTGFVSLTFLQQNGTYPAPAPLHLIHLQPLPVVIVMTWFCVWSKEYSIRNTVIYIFERYSFIFSFCIIS